MPAASAGYITALKASLANGAHGWAVTGVSETTSTRLKAVSVTGSTSGSTSGTITAGEGSVSGSVSGSTSSTNTSETIDRMTVQLAAASLRTPGQAGPMRLTYVSTKIDGAFTSAAIRQNGAELTSTDSALDTTMRGLAAAFQSAQDAALTAALGASPASDPDIAPVSSGDLVAALKASLADPDAGWVVSGGTARRVREPKQAGPDEPVEMVVVRIERSIAITSPLVRVAVNAYPPLSIAYIGVSDPDDVYQRSDLYIDGKLFTAVDEDLHDLVVGMVETTAEDVSERIVASLEYGPQTNAEITAALEAAS